MSETAHQLRDLATHAYARFSAASFLVGSHPQSDPLLVKRPEFSIHLARTPDHRRGSIDLVAKMYRARGYEVSRADEALPRAEQVTFVACKEAAVFGTLTLCIDSPMGLPADAEYRPELSAFRIANRTLAELTRFAVAPHRGSREVMGALFHVSYVFCVLRNIDDVFIEVHPRHVAFYTRMLRFQAAGDLRLCTRVGAPARLLHRTVSEVAKHAKRHATRPPVTATLYPYFCSHEESLAIADRLSASSGISAFATSATVLNSLGAEARCP